MRWLGHTAQLQERKYSQRDLIGKGEGKRPLWKYIRGWDDNATTDIKEIGWEEQDLD